MLLLPHFVAYCGQTWTYYAPLTCATYGVYTDFCQWTHNGHQRSFPSSDRPVPPMYCACCMCNLPCVEVGTGMHARGINSARRRTAYLSYGKMLTFVLFVLTIYNINIEMIFKVLSNHIISRYRIPRAQTKQMISD